MLQEFYKYFTDHFYVPLYLLTWVIAVFNYRSYFDTSLKYLPIIIMYTFINEILGILIKYSNDFQFFSDYRYTWHNVIIYNVYQLVFFLFFLEVYRKTFKSKRLKKWSQYGSYLCILAYLGDSIAHNPLHNRLVNAHIIGSVLLVVIITLYFKEKLQEGSFPPLKNNLLLWVSIGLLLFYVPFPLISIFYKTNWDIGIRAWMRPILLTSIVLMYGSFIIGLLMGKRMAFR